MRLLRPVASLGICLFALGCSEAENSPRTIRNHVDETVRASGLPPPLTVRVEAAGFAREECGNYDGPAVDFIFRVSDELPTVTVRDPNLIYSPLVYSLPLVGNQVLRIRVNERIAVVRQSGRWEIAKPDFWGGALATLCRVEGYPCDSAISGTVTFTQETDELFEIQADLLFLSKNSVKSRLSAKLIPGAKPTCLT